jgi:hypothetical protein
MTEVKEQIAVENATIKGDLKVSIRSDETVAKRNTFALALFYTPLILAFLIIPILFWLGRIARSKTNTFRIILFLIQGVTLGSVLVSFYYRI